MDRRIVMHDGLHAIIGKVLLQFVPTVALRYEVHEGVEFVWPLFRQMDRHTLQQFPVEGRIVTSAFNHLFETSKPITQDYGL